jgi:hypothetical protein
MGRPGNAPMHIAARVVFGAPREDEDGRMIEERGTAENLRGARWATGIGGCERAAARRADLFRDVR